MIIFFHLFLTLALELLVYGFGDRFRLKSMLTLFVANILLNFTMNMVATQMASETQYLIFIIGAEIFTFVVEAFLYFLFTKKKLWYCFLISFTANILSLAVGNAFNQTGLIYKNGVVNTGTVILIVVTFIELIISYVFFLRSFCRSLYNKGNESEANKESDKESNS
ncbi:MAG: hypothetical protein J5511_00105 [Bacilli bacterium]|nr:hypothetical protein [Bacilli bacterium]